MNDSYNGAHGSAIRLMVQDHVDQGDQAITHLLVHIQLAENLGRIQQVLVVVDPICPGKIPMRLAFCYRDRECRSRYRPRLAGRTSSH